jgi:hypothetical protein
MLLRDAAARDYVGGLKPAQHRLRERKKKRDLDATEGEFDATEGGVVTLAESHTPRKKEPKAGKYFSNWW